MMEEKQMMDSLLRRVREYTYKADAEDVGTVVEVGDGIAKVSGLARVSAQELLEFECGVNGIAFNLEASSVGVIILGDYTKVREGSLVKRLDRIVSVPVGDMLLGRVIDPLGNPLDGGESIIPEKYFPLERIAPDISRRSNVDTPLETGIKAIDSMIPIGRGQRELIIGDRQTGKTAIAIDTILNQKGKNVFCIYVAIGQKKSSVAQLLQKLKDHGAMDYTTLVVAAADDPAALQYIAPYAGCAIGEYFMESGRDALVVYDDLTKHAWAYRQISLLLRRPPGREAYPGDLFYLHSRLLERSAKLSKDYVLVPENFSRSAASVSDSVDGQVYSGPLGKKNAEEAQIRCGASVKICPVEGTGGSSTALPIIETLLGDVSAYVPTNVISITDGQIYLESSLFNEGIRPAINNGISVSRVGGAAQSKAMKKAAGGLRLDMAQYREVATFAQFGSDLDKATQIQLDRGKILQELLKQPQYHPYRSSDEFLVIYAGVNGWLDSLRDTQVSAWEDDFLAFMEASYASVGSEIEAKGMLTAENEAVLKEALKVFLAERNHK